MTNSTIKLFNVLSLVFFRHMLLTSLIRPTFQKSSYVNLLQATKTTGTFGIINTISAFMKSVSAFQICCHNILVSLHYTTELCYFYWIYKRFFCMCVCVLSLTNFPCAVKNSTKLTQHSHLEINFPYIAVLLKTKSLVQLG